MRPRDRPGVSEITGILIMLATVVTLGVLIFAAAGGGMRSLSENYAVGMTRAQNAAAERLVVEQASFDSSENPALDGSSTNHATGSTSSIAASLTTSGSDDLIVAYVSAADAGAASPPSVSSVAGAGLTWTQRLASSAETVPESYVPITITNGQAAATPNPFQEKVTWNPSTYSSSEASDLGNVRFCSDNECVAPLYGWLESCTPSCSPSATLATAWVQLTSAIPGSGGTLTVYIVFEPTSVDFDGNYWGEAPNLSSPYGLYDNGANVFTQYGGASWSSFTEVEGAWSTSNGYLQQTATTGSYNAGPAALIEGASYAASGSYVIDTAFQYTTHATARVGIMAVTGLTGGDPEGYRFIGQQSNNGAGFISFLNDRVAWVVNDAYTGAVSTSYTMEVVDSAGTWSGTLYSGYGTSGTSLTTLATTTYTTNNAEASATGYVGISAAYYTGTTVEGDPASFQWFVMRALPPGGVMPSATPGSISTGGYTLDLEEWYAVSSSPLTGASITATLSAPATEATWMAVYGLGGVDTASPFDPSVSVPASSSGTSPSTTISTTNSNDVLLYACAAQAGGVAAGFTNVYSNAYPPNQGEYVGYDTVSSTQSGLVTSCGTNAYGAELSDAVAGFPGGADLYVRNDGSVVSTLAGVYVDDVTSGTAVFEGTLSVYVGPGTFAEVPSSTLSFPVTDGHTYSFTVTTSYGSTVLYEEEA